MENGYGLGKNMAEVMLRLKLNMRRMYIAAQ